VAFNLGNGRATAIQGQLLRLSARREVAIYLRDDTLWVADFIDGSGEIMDARTWFRFNCASASASDTRRRMVLESAMPLYEQLEKRIEELHSSALAVSLYELLERRLEQRHRSGNSSIGDAAERPTERL
jgi:hypothetical protein